MDISKSSVILNLITIAEYLDEDNELQTVSQCEAGDGSQMDPQKILYLLEHCKAGQVSAPMVAAFMAAEMSCECECEDDVDE